MKINRLAREEVLRSLVTSEKGLSGEEAKRRFLEFGPNEIRETRKTPLVLRFLRQFTHFLAVLLWIGAGLAFLSEYLNPGEGMLALGLAILGVIVINALFTFVQEYRAEKSFEALKQLLPFHVKVLREGKEKEIYAREVVPGDILTLSGGDRVPADARIIETVYCMVNNAPLTGESEPVPLTAGACGGELIESRNIAFAGTSIVSGSAKAAVFSTGMRTEFGRIAHLTSAVEAGLSPLQKEIVKVTRVIAFLSTLMGIGFFLIGHFIGRSFWENFIFAVGIIVANVPEGLLPTVTLSLAMGSQRMAKKMALIKTLTSVETLGSVTVICTDKTGTLTQNRMEVKRVWFDRKFIAEHSIGDLRSGDIMTAARLCNNARFSDGQFKGDPTEVALLKAAGGTAEAGEAERIFEIPFDSERKRMTTLNRIGDTAIAFTKGALESVLPLCTRLRLGGESVPLDEELKKEIVSASHSLMDSGLRVLAFAYKVSNELGVMRNEKINNAALDSSLEANLVFLGLVGLEDPPRPEAAEAIGKCRGAGIRVIMMTGDGSRTALSIAREIGLVSGSPVIIEGSDFVKMRDSELRERLSAKEVLFTRMTPKHKMRIVTILKGEGERVAVTGDGVNDAPALKKADIGIAMGITGTDVAKEAADIILLDDNFATIVNAVEEGRTVYENIRRFISYIFSSNIPEIVPYLAYVLFRIPLPLTIMQILAVDLGTDMLPALALGAEKPTPAVMKQPPRPPGERLLNAKLLGRAYLFLGPIEAVACMSGFFLVLKLGGWQWGEFLPAGNPLYMQATTACLTAIIITQAANVFACRSDRESVFSIGLFSNRLIFLGIATEVLLQFFIVYHPWGNMIFSTSPISLHIWLVLIPFAFLLFFAEEGRKFAVRNLRRG
ncbi:MAG: cation-transporting P-type ATPase [Nitrospirota bacterium]|nr:cation-transporting P-type ATPase [Nitrospirota bacterium]